MGKLQQAQDVEAGAVLLAELRRYGSDMDSIVSSIVQLVQNYDAYRAGLDVDDVPYADESLDFAIAANKPKIDGLSVSQKERLDIVMAGIGYSPTV